MARKSAAAAAAAPPAPVAPGDASPRPAARLVPFHPFAALLALLATRRAAGAFVLLAALLLRLLVGLHPHSGEGAGPMFGDYEAQRHWMAVTLHTPPSEWYADTPTNDLQYWGLDYPPLTAYQSWAYGAVIHRIEPGAVALLSRGYETPSRCVPPPGAVPLKGPLRAALPASVWAIGGGAVPPV